MQTDDRTLRNRDRLSKITVTDLPNERWKDVPSYEGLYKVSNIGRVKSLFRQVERKDGMITTVVERVLKSSSIHGYRQVVLMRDSIAITYRVHRLVAMAFIENTFNKPFINHKNGIRDDNRVENIEWCTESENTAHSYSHLGRVPRMGQQINTNKLTPEQVVEIRSKYIPRKYSYSKLAKEYGVDVSAIGLIVKRKNWKHIL